MCNTVYPARAIVIIKSKYDDHYWIIRGDRKIEKLSPKALSDKFAKCINYPELTYCPDEGTIIVWSPRGLSGVGFTYAEPDEDVWCNIRRLSSFLEGKLPEPISEEVIESAKREMEWLIGLSSQEEVMTA